MSFYKDNTNNDLYSHYSRIVNGTFSEIPNEESSFALNIYNKCIDKFSNQGHFIGKLHEDYCKEKAILKTIYRNYKSSHHSSR